MNSLHETLKNVCLEYLEISKEELDKRIKESQSNFIKEWNEKENILDFYKKTDQYIYDLIEFNDDFRVSTVTYPLMSTKGMKILDYGAGIGMVSSHLATQHTVYYYDIGTESKKFAEFLNKQLKTDVEFLDTEKEAFDTDIDCIVCVDVLEHLEKPMELVKKITNKLKYGQWFLTTGLDFSIGKHIPMHLIKNSDYFIEYTEYMENNYVLFFFNRTVNEFIYLWRKK